MEDYTNKIETAAYSLKQQMYDIYSLGFNDACAKIGLDLESFIEDKDTKDKVIKRIKEIIINYEIENNFDRSVNSGKPSNEAMASLTQMLIEDANNE